MNYSIQICFPYSPLDLVIKFQYKFFNTLCNWNYLKSKLLNIGHCKVHFYFYCLDYQTNIFSNEHSSYIGILCLKIIMLIYFWWKKHVTIVKAVKNQKVGSFSLQRISKNHVCKKEMTKKYLPNWDTVENVLCEAVKYIWCKQCQP